MCVCERERDGERDSGWGWEGRNDAKEMSGLLISSAALGGCCQFGPVMGTDTGPSCEGAV